MVEPSLEFNLGSFGSHYGKAQMQLLMLSQGKFEFSMSFTDPSDARRKGHYIKFTDYTFFEFYNLVVAFENQVQKLKASGEVKELRYPNNSELKFKSNLGSVTSGYTTLSLALSIQSDGCAYLQIYAGDSDAKKSGVIVFGNEDDYEKLKKVLVETHHKIIKPRPQPQVQPKQKPVPASQQPVQGSPKDGVPKVKLTAEGQIISNIQTVADARTGIHDISLIKKELYLKKREIDENMRQIRANYTDSVRRQGSKVLGGGFIGTVIRSIQTSNRDSNRYNLAQQLQPLDNQKRQIEAVIIGLDKFTLELQKYIFGQR